MTNYHFNVCHSTEVGKDGHNVLLQAGTGLLQSLLVKSPRFACNAGDPGLIPGSGRSPREGNGNPLQYPCLENPMDRGAWQATVHWATQSRT